MMNEQQSYECAIVEEVEGERKELDQTVIKNKNTFKLPENKRLKAKD